MVLSYCSCLVKVAPCQTLRRKKKRFSRHACEQGCRQDDHFGPVWMMLLAYSGCPAALGGVWACVS